MSEIIVTAMIVVRNEEKYIKTSLGSFLDQDFPKENYEILVIDGMSTDSTRKIINEIIEENKTKVKISLVNNEKKLLASGWNIGIKKAEGKYVIRIDAHAKASESFISKSLEVIESLPEDVGCVGGKLESVSLEQGDIVIEKVLSSPFGIGNSKFRYSTQAGYTDTVAFGLYKKEIFDKVRIF